MPPPSGGSQIGAGTVATGVAGLIMIAFQLVNLHYALRTYRYRAAPHIAKRNLGVVLSSQLVLSLGHASLCLTFIFGFAGMYTGQVAAVMAEVSTLAGVCGTCIITGGIFFKLSLVYLKFREREMKRRTMRTIERRPPSDSDAPRDSTTRMSITGSLQSLVRERRTLLLQDKPCFASFDLRSARSQHLFLGFVWAFALSVWVLNFGIRTTLCYTVYSGSGCGDKSDVGVVPLDFITSVIIIRALWRLSGLGPIDESLGVLKEVRGLIRVLVPTILPGDIILILMNFKVLGPAFIIVVAFNMNLAMCGVLYYSHVCLARPDGYESACCGSGRRIKPLAVPMYLPPPLLEDPDSPDTNTSASPREAQADTWRRWTQRRRMQGGEASDSSAPLAWLRPRPPSAAVAPPERPLPGVTQLDKARAALYVTLTGTDAELVAKLQDKVEVMVMARRMLSEEAVRCAFTIMRLRLEAIHVSGSHSRELLRSGWEEFMKTHLNDSAPLPLSLTEQHRQDLLRLMQRSVRRRVLFNDDIQAVTQALDKVSDEISPTVYPVLLAVGIGPSFDVQNKETHTDAIPSGRQINFSDECPPSPRVVASPLGASTHLAASPASPGTDLTIEDFTADQLPSPVITP